MRRGAWLGPVFKGCAALGFGLWLSCSGGGGGGGNPPPPPAAPSISGLSPTSGSVGTAVTITGTNLDSVTAVLFGATPAVIGTRTAAQLATTVPAGASTGTLSVTGPGGTATSTTTFTVLPAPPTLTGFNPTSGPVGSTVVITGTNFSSASSVTFNSVSALFTVNSATQITATVPAGATSGTIAVSTPGGTATSATGFTVTSSGADPGAARIFFTDLTSGPNTGGQDGLGVFITIYGEGFGAARGNSVVTIGGQEVSRYVIWGQDNAVARTLDMIVVQPGPNVASGNIVVTVNGHPSNPLPFTVRSGNIYFVIPGAPNANDANPGTYTEPFQTLYRPRQVMQAGDTVYIRGGTFNASDPANPGWDAVLLLNPGTDPNGTADRPVAYIGYPGDQPLINAPEPLRRGIYMDQAMAYYIIANLEFTQGLAPYEGMLQMGGNGHRAVGNYLHDALSSTGMGIAGNSAHYKVLGNLIRNNGQGDWEDGVGFYIQGFGTNRDIDFGWNEIRDQRGRRAIQLFGHEAGDRMEDIRIHDNQISSSLQLRNNILLGGSDGGTEVLGTILVYNNIIVGADWGGLRVNDPQGTILILNNVLYDNGTLGSDSNAQLFIERAGTGRITFQNNILYAESGQTYYSFGAGMDASVFNAVSNNLVYNAGAGPAWDVNCINANPLFGNLVLNDFRLQPSSPAIDSGTDSGVDTDYMGIWRPQGARFDIGAYEHVAQ